MTTTTKQNEGIAKDLPIDQRGSWLSIDLKVRHGRKYDYWTATVNGYIVIDELEPIEKSNFSGLYMEPAKSRFNEWFEGWLACWITPAKALELAAQHKQSAIGKELIARLAARVS